MKFMVDANRIREFRAQWQYELGPNEDFIRFRTRMTEVARLLWVEYFEDEKYNSRQDRRQRFAIISGTFNHPHHYFQQSGLGSLLHGADTVPTVAEAIQQLLWTAEEVLHERDFDYCCRAVQDALDHSPAIMMRLVRSGKKAMLLPTGARMLDQAVVESNLVWLARYPQVLKSFEEALKLYAMKDPRTYRNMLDNLRFAIEQMLRTVLNNRKNLENQKDEFLRWLAQHDVHSSIGHMYLDLLLGFAEYQNDAVKHKEDKYTPAEVEFALYATGTFLRLIQRLVEQESLETAAQGAS
jgi:hypothetical protein